MSTTKARKATRSTRRNTARKISTKKGDRTISTHLPASAVEASLLRSAAEAFAFVRGDHSKGRVTHILTARTATVKAAPAVTPSLVKSLRAEHQLSQDLFARVLGVSPETVKGWEQGKKHPSGAAARLLQIAREYPNWVEEQIDERKTASA